MSDQSVRKRSPKAFLFYGVHSNRIRVSIPGSIRPEVIRISKPSNHDTQNPSFVFDYLACKVEDADTCRTLHPTKDDFCWAEVKTGLGMFSDNQCNMLLEIRLPIAVFHIEDIMAKPQHIDMDWDIMSGKKFARMLEDDSKDEHDPHYFQDDNYHSDAKRNTGNIGRSGRYGSNYGSQRGGITAKFSSTCRVCNRKIIAGKDKVRQNSYGNWVHAWCASQKF